MAIWRFTFKWVYQFVSDPHLGATDEGARVPGLPVMAVGGFKSWESQRFFCCHGVPVVSGGLGDKLGGGEEKPMKHTKEGMKQIKKIQKPIYHCSDQKNVLQQHCAEDNLEVALK